VAAVAEASNSLYHLSLEELLDVQVSVASTESETVIETPAIVSRYNRIDLEKMGITTLREMFNFIPGIIVQDSLAGWASVQIRGIDETFNQKVLFLLDGIPYHQPSHSLIPMEGVPWESISHVEVIRGPGAVFYGTQASGGVLNVITQKDVGEKTASIKVGSHGLYEGSAYYNSELSETSALYLAAEYRTEDGYSAPYEEVFPSVGLIRDDVNRYLERKSGLLRYTNDGFTLLAHAFSDATVGINDAYTDENTLQPMVLETMGRLIHIEKRWSTDNSQTTLFADYNHYTFEIQLHNLFAPDVGALVKKDGDGKDDYRLRLGAKFAYKVNESLDLAMGLEQETRSIGDYRIYFLDEPNDPLALLLEKGKTDEFSAYAQLGYTFKNWRFLMGGRFTNNENNGQKITPRAAFVYKVDEHQSIKALYSTGFNSPNPTQTDINLPGDVVGNEALSAEIVKTFDVAYSYSKSNLLFVANVYHLEAEDFIQRKFSEALASISFFNEGGFKRRGAELDLQMASEGRKLFVNVSYQKEGNKVLLDDSAAFSTPKLTFSVGASMDIFGTHSIGGDISYIGERYNLDSYSIVNLNYTARFSDLELFALARNVLDEEILNPNISTQNSELVARGEEGVNVQLGFRMHF
jgi:outer membrane receptor protein involved in Fe transport